MLVQKILSVWQSLTPRMTNAAGWDHGLLGRAGEGPVSGAALTQDWDAIAETIVTKMMFSTDQAAPGYPVDFHSEVTRAGI